MEYVFVHGLGQSPSSWDHIIDTISDKPPSVRIFLP